MRRRYGAERRRVPVAADACDVIIDMRSCLR